MSNAQTFVNAVAHEFDEMRDELAMGKAARHDMMVAREMAKAFGQDAEIEIDHLSFAVSEHLRQAGRKWRNARTRQPGNGEPLNEYLKAALLAYEVSQVIALARMGNRMGREITDDELMAAFEHLEPAQMPARARERVREAVLRELGHDGR